MPLTAESACNTILYNISARIAKARGTALEDAMVTGRMSAAKKAAGGKVLAKAGLNANQAINLLYDKLEQEQSADFLTHRKPEPREWESAIRFIDALAAPVPVHTRFDDMTRAEIKLERAKAKGWV